MIKSKNLSFSYGERTLFTGLDFSLTPGITVLLGPNGCGKTTLLKLLAGALTPGSGELLLDGTPMQKISNRERVGKIAVVPQFPPPALDFSVEELIQLGLHAGSGLFTAETVEDQRKINDILKRLELERYRNTPCSRLSGGELQRAAVAQALVRATPVLLLDEPTASMDPAHAIRLMEILHDLPSTPYILVVSHDIFLSGRFADRAVLLADGKIAADGTADEVLTAARLAEIYAIPEKYFSFFAKK
jgi:iron complex transport system ATP-binding protein